METLSETCSSYGQTSRHDKTSLSLMTPPSLQSAEMTRKIDHNIERKLEAIQGWNPTTTTNIPSLCYCTGFMCLTVFLTSFRAFESDCGFLH